MSLAGCRWPVDPLKSGMLKALGDLGMPRFTRRYPRLCDSIVKQVVEMAHVRAGSEGLRRACSYINA